MSKRKCDKQPAFPTGDKRGVQAPDPHGPTYFYNTLILFTQHIKYNCTFYMEQIGPLIPDFFPSDTILASGVVTKQYVTKRYVTQW